MEDVTKHVFRDADRFPLPVSRYRCRTCRACEKCGKAEQGFARLFQALWESAVCADFHSASFFIRPVPVLVVLLVGLKSPSMNRFPGNISRQDRLWAMAGYGAGLEHVPFSFLFATGGAAVNVQSRPADSGMRGSGGLVVVEATEDSLSNRARPHVVQLGAGLTRAAPYQRFRNRFISKASLRRSMW